MSSGTKEQIVASAFKLFLEEGYETTTMSQLVGASKVSKGAFYHYFSSKQEVYDFVIERYFLGYFKEVQWETLDALSLDEVKKKIIGSYQSLLQDLIEATDGQLSRYFLMFFHNYQKSAVFKRTVQTFYSQMRNLLSKKLRQNGDETSKREAVLFISQLEGLFFWKAIFPEDEV